MIRIQIEEIAHAIDEMKSQNSERWTIKQMESQKKRLEEQIKKMTSEERKDDLITFEELGIDSIPLNALMPIPGTPLEHLPRLSEADILRTVAFFRYINPLANIRLGAGRALLTNDGETAFKAGASATITGNMLTTVACATIRSDRKMLNHMGRDIKPEYMTDEEAAAIDARAEQA